MVEIDERTMNERLVSLFYLLMRDAVPTGALLKAVNESKEIIDDVNAVFTNDDLANIARRYVNKLLGD